MRKRELFRYLGYEPHPGQVAVHRSRAPRRILACGARWGKSTCAAMEAVAALMTPCERSIGWVVAPSYDLAERIFTMVKDTVTRHLAHRVLEVSDREHRFRIHNLGGGISELRAKSADNPVSLLGEGLDWLIVDEAARLRRDIWEAHLAQRLLDKGGWALLVSTPRGRGWFYGLYRRAQAGDPTYEAWASPSWENRHLDPAAIEAERERLPEQVFMQEYGAEFVGDGATPCDMCSGPNTSAKGIVLVREDEQLARCKECGKAVDADGNSLVRLQPDGHARLKVIRLVRDEEREAAR